MENALRLPREEHPNQSLEDRLSVLEDRMDHVELILAGLLPASRRRSGSIVSWLWGLLQTHRIEPGSTDGPG